MDSASPLSGLSEYHEDEEELDEWDEQLVESDEDGHELDELDEQLGEPDKDHHKTRRVEEQLDESDEFSLDYVCVCICRVARRELDM